MKKRPILFNAEMVRAVLDGRKTQTRRIVNPKFDWDLLYFLGKNPGESEYNFFADTACGKYECGIRCPYGKPGDELWVRETHAVVQTGAAGLNAVNSFVPYDPVVVYRADGHDTPEDAAKHVSAITEVEGWRSENNKWRPPIFMRRRDSRIQLRITDVRVERVQDISEEDARTEGCVGDEDPYWRPTYNDPDSGGYPSFKNSFKFLWDSINEKRGYGWDKNPWVWVVEFEVVK